jgi:hypothetical protein
VLHFNRIPQLRQMNNTQAETYTFDDTLGKERLNSDGQIHHFEIFTVVI